MDRKVELLIEADHLLGESPMWDDRNQILYWTDIERGEIHFYNETTKELTHHVLGGKVTSIALCESGNLLITKKDTIILYNPVTGQEQCIVRTEFPDAIRFNDGKCDPSGRFYGDTMDMTGKEEAGSLFILDSDGNFREAATGFIIGNGLAWNEENTLLYLVDSPKKVVYQFDYCAETGAVKNRKAAIQIPDNAGVPDGICIDRKGMLWIAHYFGARITRWNPVSGELLETIPVPAGNVTSCCFGGSDMKSLYVTTSNMNLPDIPAADTYDGSIFRIKTDVRGYESVRFNDGKFLCSEKLKAPSDIQS
ncbi:MAG: SMP-30/gluconolactonase/LRE family protein [Lacrimispora sp.]|uniref:SMP-30/gluconolactonase/LRE family protein n=1 Tax=Lacrimispora sp. TaxID=2719234 RepID=UPI0039E566D7